MSRSYRFDGELFDALAAIAHYHVAMISLYGTAVEGPRYLQRRVAFGHHALHRHEISGINGLLTEGDRCYLWRDCDTNDKIKYDSKSGKTICEIRLRKSQKMMKNNHQAASVVSSFENDILHKNKRNDGNKNESDFLVAFSNLHLLERI